MPVTTSNLEAFTATVDSDRLKPSATAAEIVAARNLAIAVDDSPQNAALWSRYLEALAGVLEDDVVDDGLADAVAALQSEVRDSPPAGT